MNVLPSKIHDPTTLNRRARSLAKALGLNCRVWHRHEGEQWLVLNSPPPKSPEASGKRLYLSGGIHGDEAASVWAGLDWLEEHGRKLVATRTHSGRRPLHLTLIPCLNPWGLRHNSRFDAGGRDLNRTYHKKRMPLIAAHQALLSLDKPFDLALLLHEDYDALGYYIYEVVRKRQSLWGHEILEAIRAVCPADARRSIEGRKAQGGLIAPRMENKKLVEYFKKIGMPEAVYLFRAGCPRVYTLESPSEMAFESRRAAHRLAIQQAVQLLLKKD